MRTQDRTMGAPTAVGRRTEHRGLPHACTLEDEVVGARRRATRTPDGKEDTGNKSC
jgi:hypothetical protein